MANLIMVVNSLDATAAIGPIPVAATWLAAGGIVLALLDLWRHFRTA